MGHTQHAENGRRAALLAKRTDGKRVESTEPYVIPGDDLSMLVIPGERRAPGEEWYADPRVATTVITFDAEFMRVYSALPKHDPTTKRGRW